MTFAGRPSKTNTITTPMTSRGRLAPAPSNGRARSGGVRPLRNLEGISGGEFARWIKITTPRDRPHVIRLLETAASILRDELEGEP